MTEVSYILFYLDFELVGNLFGLGLRVRGLGHQGLPDVVHRRVEESSVRLHQVVVAELTLKVKTGIQTGPITYRVRFLRRYL